jgi:hypothetical protein
MVTPLPWPRNAVDQLQSGTTRPLNGRTRNITDISILRGWLFEGEPTSRFRSEHCADSSLIEVALRGFVGKSWCVDSFARYWRSGRIPIVRYFWTADGLPDSAGPPFANAWPDRLGADPALTKTEGGVRCTALAWGDLRRGERPSGTDDRRATGQRQWRITPFRRGLPRWSATRVPTGERGSNGGRLPDSPT